MSNKSPPTNINAKNKYNLLIWLSLTENNNNSKSNDNDNDNKLESLHLNSQFACLFVCASLARQNNTLQ